ncbi:MAG: LuxR C-terminal-related transcriptional regulator, partial [Trebonia sp.]
GQARLLLAVVSLLLAGQRGDLPAMTEQGQRLAAMTEGEDAAQPGLGEELRALALISLGSALYWTARREEAEEHLERGVALARRIGLPYLEFIGLANQAAAVLFHSYVQAEAHGLRAIELARRHGWTGEPVFGVACGALATLLAGQGRPDEAEPWIREAERTLTAGARPAQYLAIRYDRGVLEQARGRDAAALAAFEAVEPLARRLASAHLIIPRARAQIIHSLVRLGQTERAAQVLAGLGDQDRERGEIRIAAATLRLAQSDHRAALTELAPILDPGAPVSLGFWLIMAYVLEAAARDALGEQSDAHSALERALDLAEPDGALTPFLLASPSLLDRHARRGTAHASLIAGIRDMLNGISRQPAASRPQPLLEPLSGSELRVLRYLPTNLTVPEIARELYVSPNTVRTQVKSLYAKLGTHHRAEAVERARALGLLAPARPSRDATA